MTKFTSRPSGYPNESNQGSQAPDPADIAHIERILADLPAWLERSISGLDTFLKNHATVQARAVLQQFDVRFLVGPELLVMVEGDLGQAIWRSLGCLPLKDEEGKDVRIGVMHPLAGGN